MLVAEHPGPAGAQGIQHGVVELFLHDQLIVSTHDIEAVLCLQQADERADVLQRRCQKLGMLFGQPAGGANEVAGDDDQIGIKTVRYSGHLVVKGLEVAHVQVGELDDSDRPGQCWQFVAADVQVGDVHPPGFDPARINQEQKEKDSSSYEGKPEFG